MVAQSETNAAPIVDLNIVEKSSAPPAGWTIAEEYKIVCLREIAVEMAPGDHPGSVAEYWNAVIATHPYFNPECECFVVLLLNTHRKIKGNHLVSIGTLDTVLAHPREVFRAAVVSASSAIILMHNHPSGNSTPSDADIRVTRELLRAGHILKIEVLDHVIMGRATSERPWGYTSLRELGYFYGDYAPGYIAEKPARLNKAARNRLEALGCKL